MIVGFTGSRNGLNDTQQTAIRACLIELGANEVHHGDCVGADKAFDAIAHELGLKVVIHPPSDEKMRAFCSGEVLPAKKFIDRNHDIVDACVILIGAPTGSKEQRRSGTWATIRYARKQCVEVRLFPASENA